MLLPTAAGQEATPVWKWEYGRIEALVNKVRAGEDMTPKKWPGGARVAVALSFDMDAETGFLRSGQHSPQPLSRGEYGPRVGVPRILKLLDQHRVPVTFFIPAVSGELHREAVDAILKSPLKHEIGVHGWVHERLTELAPGEERELTRRAFDYWTKRLGRKPAGIRTPSWDFTSETLGIIRELGFLYDSSLMGDDRPYEILAEGKRTGLIELPVEWILDDATYYSYDRAAHAYHRMSDDDVFQIYRDEFDRAYEEGTMFLLTMHPFMTGHRSRMTALERLVVHMKSKAGVWFATHEQVALAAAAQLRRTEVKEVENPAPAGSTQGFLSRGLGGAVYLSWMEAGGFRFARWEKGRWGETRTIAEQRRFFLNWADYTSLVELPGGALAAHWLEKQADSKYAYGLRVAMSWDGGRSWKTVFAPEVSKADDYTGFVSLLPLKDGLGVSYLAPTAHGGHDGHEAKTLRYAVLDGKGRLVSDKELDGDVCSCCQTSAVETGKGPVVLYRDHTGETRDISVAGADGVKALHADGWKINACPVNGPAADARGGNMAAAWFTGAEGRPRVLASFSGDDGRSFGGPVVVSGDNPIGRVALRLLADGSAAVVWLERVTEEKAELRLRRVQGSGELGEMVVIAQVDSARRTGFPHLVEEGGRLWVSWTGESVRTVVVDPAYLKLL